MCGVSTALVTMLFLALETAEGLKAGRCSDVTVMKGPEQFFREEKQPNKNRGTTTGLGFLVTRSSNSSKG